MLGCKFLAPVLQRAGIVLAKRKLVNHFKPGGGGLRAKCFWAWQATTRKNILLNKVSRRDVSLKQVVCDHNALNAGVTTRFKQAMYCLKILRPILLAHGFNHFNGANGVKRCVLSGFADVAVVLQPQVYLIKNAAPRHALVCPVQLLSAQRHAHNICIEFLGGFFSQRAPAATNLQHTVARFDMSHAQSPPHFGVLGVLHGGLRRIKYGR